MKLKSLPIHTTITKLREQMFKNKVIKITIDKNQIKKNT
jgi:hypothetical protein